MVLPFILGETHDLDDVFESVLIDHRGRSSLFKMGKLGILWEIDRATGDFVAAHDLGYQTLVDVDPQTGRATYRPGTIPEDGVELEFCPDFGGIRNWRASAYHPETQALYIPIHPTCVKGTFNAVTREAHPSPLRLTELLRESSLDRVAIGRSAVSPGESRPRRPPDRDGHR